MKFTREQTVAAVNEVLDGISDESYKNGDTKRWRSETLGFEQALDYGRGLTLLETAIHSVVYDAILHGKEGITALGFAMFEAGIRVGLKLAEKEKGVGA